MDCFYAAIEVRDDPALRGKPVAVGGVSRGVLTTANYEARKFGSAMPTFKALQLCPDLVVRPTRFDVYKEESQKIGRIFHRFTDLVEPLSLDEAYLDVTDHGEEGAAVASRIRGQIEEETGLTASAGIAPNKLLAKIASDWNKPDGQFEIKPGEIEEFMEHLPVTRLHGVGRKTAEKLFAIEVRTCGDLQCLSKLELAEQFGSWGLELYLLCRGREGRSDSEVGKQRKDPAGKRLGLACARGGHGGVAQGGGGYSFIKICRSGYQVAGCETEVC